MYERFFNLRERPFSLSPDPAYLYPSRGTRKRSTTSDTASKGTPGSSS